MRNWGLELRDWVYGQFCLFGGGGGSGSQVEGLGVLRDITWEVERSRKNLADVGKNHVNRKLCQVGTSKQICFIH